MSTKSLTKYLRPQNPVHEILRQKPMGLCYVKVALNILELEIISLAENVNINKINILIQSLLPIK